MHFESDGSLAVVLGLNIISFRGPVFFSLISIVSPRSFTGMPSALRIITS